MTDEFGFNTQKFQQFYKSIVNSINSMKTEPNKTEEVKKLELLLESIKELLLHMEELLPQKKSRKKYFTELESFLKALKKFNFNAKRLKEVHWRFWQTINQEIHNTDGENFPDGEPIKNIILKLDVEKKLPDDELVQSIILTLRFFLDQSENMSIEKIAESYENRRTRNHRAGLRYPFRSA